MRIHTKIALAFAVITAAGGCRDNQNDPQNVPDAENYVYTAPDFDYDMRRDPYNEQFLIHAENVPLVRAGKDFTATISGYCDGFDQSDLAVYTKSCTDYLTKKIQDDALTHRFFTANKWSTDSEFIKAGLQSRPKYHEAEIAARLVTPERIQDRVENKTHNFYVIENVSDLKTADITLDLD